VQLSSSNSIRAFILTMTLTAASAYAQTQPAQPVEGEASTNCFSTHTLGKLRVCISEHGNIIRLESPIGTEHIRVGAIREGYSLCAIVGLFGGTNVISHDVGDSEANFTPALSIVQPVPNAFPLTITRTTTSGLQFIQKFSGDSTEGDLTITMTVRNLSNSFRFNVALDRYFDGDINATPGNDLYSRTADAVWGYENNSNGVKLADVQLLPATPHTTAVHPFFGWTPASCGQASSVTPTAAGDFVGRLSYGLGIMAPGASKTVRVSYSRL
jgi:hypothetical protein